MPLTVFDGVKYGQPHFKLYLTVNLKVGIIVSHKRRYIMSLEAYKKAIIDAAEKFSAVQNKFAKVGACDSEVSHEKYQVMVDAIKGREWKPRTVNGWQLYSSIPAKETRPAVAQLNTAGKRLHKAVASAPLSAREWLNFYYGIDYD